MTLDEAIEYYDGLERENTENFELCPHPCDGLKDCMCFKRGEGCVRLAEKYRDLVKWLKELKRLRDQHPDEDCISRLAAIDLIADFDLSMGQVVKGIHDLPPVTPQPKWTPVAENPPKENEWYQCTVILGDLSLTMDLYYKNGKWLDNRAIKMFNTYDIYGYGYDNAKHKLSYQELISEFDWTEKVVAWMPSPEPYKTESEK